MLIIFYSKVDSGGVARVAGRRSPPEFGEHLAFLNKFEPVTYKYFVIGSKLGQIFCFSGSNIYS